MPLLSRECRLERAAKPFIHRLLSIFLHLRVNGGVYLKAIRIYVVIASVRLRILKDPAVKRVLLPLHRVRVVIADGYVPCQERTVVAALRTHGLLSGYEPSYFFAEIRRATFAVVHFVIIESERKLLDRVGLLTAELPGLHHLVYDHIPAAARTLLVAQRIVIARVLEHTNEHGGLLHFEVARLLAEIHIGSRLDSHCIVEEIKTVEIHVYYLVLGVVALELHSYHPLDRLLHGPLEQARRRLRIKLFGQLLRDGGGTSRRLVAQKERLEHRAAERAEVDSGMLLKTHILGRYERVYDKRRHRFVVGIYTVAASCEIASEFRGAVPGHDHRSQLVVGILKFLDGRHIPYHSVVDKKHQDRNHKTKAEKRAPKNPDSTAVTVMARLLLGSRRAVQIVISLFIAEKVVVVHSVEIVSDEMSDMQS